jgi:Tol biopolymer transport system component
VYFGDQDEKSSSVGLYVRGTDGSDAIHVGETDSPAHSGLSPDGRWVLVEHQASGGKEKSFELLPTGAGEARAFTIRGPDEVEDFRWFPDGERLLATGRSKGGKYRDYVVPLSGGDARPVTPEDVWSALISPDGKSLLAHDEQGGLSIYPVEGGPARRIMEKFPYPVIQWSADGKSVYVTEEKSLGRISRLDLATGRVELWKDLQPSDPTGAVGVVALHITPDAKAYTYTYVRYLSDLYLVEGLR